MGPLKTSLISKFATLTALLVCLVVSHIVKSVIRENEITNTIFGDAATQQTNRRGSLRSIHDNNTLSMQQPRPGADSKTSENLLQIQAHEALRRMDERNAFNTPLTTRASVLERGFPMSWDPCTIQNIVDTKKAKSEPLQVVLLAGSCTARAANNCSMDPESPLYGRFSDYLQTALDEEALHDSNAVQWEIANFAQGSTGSTMNGLTMDVLVDPLKADLLVWEFSINDNWTFTKIRMRAFSFWLTRVEALFAQAGRPRPPILLLFLYEFYTGLPFNHDKIIQDGLDTPLRGGWRMIEHYRKQGWNFQVVSLGSTVVNSTAVAEDPMILLDDEHHPNCQSVKLIGDMMMHAFQTDLAQCGSSTTALENEEQVSAVVDANNISESFTTQSLLRDIPKVWKGLWELLMRPDVRVGSLTPWEPKPEGQSNLRIGNLDEIHRLELQITEKVQPSREDRKLGYTMPRCSNGWADFILLEPTLEWLGLGKNKKQGEVAMMINGVVIDKSRLESRKPSSTEYVSLWGHVPSLVDRAETYRISLCNNATRGDFFLRQLVGVMAPLRNSTKEVLVTATH